ncbi:hypothetical protein D3C74_483160 [compost metagenome]
MEGLLGTVDRNTFDVLLQTEVPYAGSIRVTFNDFELAFDVRVQELFLLTKIIIDRFIRIVVQKDTLLGGIRGLKRNG